MSKYAPYIIIGSIFGAIHGLILWAALTTFSSVPVFTRAIMYKNTFTIIGVTDVVIVITVLSSIWWLPKLEQLFLEG